MPASFDSLLPAPAYKLTRQYLEGRQVAGYIYARVELELELVDAHAQLESLNAGEFDNRKYEEKRIARIERQLEYIDTRLDWFQGK